MAEKSSTDFYAGHFYAVKSECDNGYQIVNCVRGNKISILACVCCKNGEDEDDYIIIKGGPVYYIKLIFVCICKQP